MSVCTIDVGLELRKANNEGFKEGYSMGLSKGLTECTDEEFKAEAKRRGYNLIKIQPYVKLLPCVCGDKPVLWSDPDGNFYRCDECWSRSPSHKRIRQARLNWNKMIEEKMKDVGEENS